MNAIEIRNLTKSFRGMYALNGFNMTVPQGAIYGFIGENGSGVYQNLMMQAINLGLEDPDGEIMRVLRIVRMEDNASLKFKSCSLGLF